METDIAPRRGREHKAGAHLLGNVDRSAGGGGDNWRKLQRPIQRVGIRAVESAGCAGGRARQRLVV